MQTYEGQLSDYLENKDTRIGKKVADIFFDPIALLAPTDASIGRTAAEGVTNPGLQARVRALDSDT